MGLMGIMGLMGGMGLMPISPLLPIFPISPAIPIIAVLTLPVFSGSIHLFLNATILDKISFFPFYQSTDKHITLMDESDGYVGNGLIGALPDFLPIDG